jgi:hypothetical protein
MKNSFFRLYDSRYGWDRFFREDFRSIDPREPQPTQDHYLFARLDEAMGDGEAIQR